MNPNTPDTPLDTTPVSPEPTIPLAIPEVASNGNENLIESSMGENSQAVSSSETDIPTLSDTIGSPSIMESTTTVDPLLSTESVANSIVSYNDPSTEPVMTSETTPMEANPSTILNSSENLATPSVTDISSTPIENISDTPKKGKGILFGVLGVLGLTIIGSVGFAGYTYYDRVTHPDWTASEIGVFIRDGVIDSLTSHAMVLSGSEPTFTTINTNYTLSGEGKGLEMTGFKNANATLNMSGSAYMEPLVASGSLPVFDGSFTMTLALEGSGKKGVKGSLVIGVDAKSTGGTILYIKPNNIKLIAPDISEQLGQEIPVAQIESSIDELNKTYLGKWYRIDLKQAGEELPKLASEIPGVPYGLPTESIDTEKFIKEQQEAEKQMKEHLGKLKAIFDKHTLIKATARDTGWKSYLDPRSITYDASLNKDGVKSFILDIYQWVYNTPVGEGKTAGVTYDMETISGDDEEDIKEMLDAVTLELIISGDMKDHGNIELKKFTVHDPNQKDGPLFAIHDFLKTKVDRDGEIVTVVKSGSICGITQTQSGTTKSICEREKYSRPYANFVYTANATLAPQNFSLTGNVDILGYNDEKKSFDEKLGLIKFDMNAATSDNTATKFTQKINLNVDTHIEQVNTNVKFSLDGSQMTEKAAKRTVDPVSESIDVLEMIKNPPLKGNVPIISYADMSKHENSDIQVQVQSDASAHSNNAEYQTLAEKLNSCTPYQSQFEHPFTGDMMERKILGMVNGKCSYVESMPNNGKMECNYTDDRRVIVAQYYKDMSSATNPLQTSLDDGSCVISGY